MRTVVCLLVSLCSCLWTGAQTCSFHIKNVCERFKNLSLFVAPMESGVDRGIQLVSDGGVFHGEVPVASDGFYLLYGVNNETQLTLPLYLPKTELGSVMNLTLQDGCPQVNNDADNVALSAFNKTVYRKGRDFWLNGKQLRPEQIKDNLKEYETVAEDIIKKSACAAPVADYLRIWAYTCMANDFENIPRATGYSYKDVPFKSSDLLRKPEEVLNTPMALYFTSSRRLVVKSLPVASLHERLSYLYAHYTCEPVRKAVGDMLADSFVRSFNYAENFEEGLLELSSALKDFKLDERFLKEFKSHLCTIKGAPFPSSVKLTDVEGNVVDFTSYRGCYVYVDLWASWCVPCRREVPYLQQLEKELQNDAVKFVSISIDKGVKEWKSAMEKLEMNGIQLINQDNSLADALNISSIPHFLIYDKEGRLLHYDAPRPSSPEIKPLLENLQ